MSSIRNAIIGGLFAATAMAGAAHATLAVNASSNGSTASNSSAGTSVVLVAPLDVFTTNIDVGLSTAKPSLDLGGSIVSSGAGTLVITLSEDGLSGPVGSNWLSQFSGNFTAIGGSPVSVSVTLQTYLGDVLYGTQTLLSTISSSLTPFGASDIAQAASPVGAYALTEVMTITTSGATSFSLDGSVSNVPEPASLGLLGVGLIGLGLVARRRAQQS